MPTSVALPMPAQCASSPACMRAAIVTTLIVRSLQHLGGGTQLVHNQHTGPGVCAALLAGFVHASGGTSGVPGRT